MAATRTVYHLSENCHGKKLRATLPHSGPSLYVITWETCWFKEVLNRGFNSQLVRRQRSTAVAMWVAIVTLLGALHSATAISTTVSEDVGFRQWLTDNHGPKLARPQMANTSLSVITKPDGSLGLAEVPDAQKRPLKIAFYNAMDPTQSEETVEYIMGRIMPSAVRLLGRYIRVRKNHAV